MHISKAMYVLYQGHKRIIYTWTVSSLVLGKEIQKLLYSELRLHFVFKCIKEYF